MRFLAALAATAALFVFAAPALATPVATDDGSYQALGRVFPDPLAGCSNSGGVCSPTANGNVPAQQFIGIDEFVNAITYMNSKPAWQRYMEIEALDGKLGDGAGSGKAPDVPGNNLNPEFTPNKDFVSAGLPTTALDRQKSDLMVVRVTDESVPDAGKKRYALSLSIHGIERAGAEGGTRAMEDLVTAHTVKDADGKLIADDAIVPNTVHKNSPTYGDVLKKTIIYFTYPNPDGWRRGSVSSGPDGGVFFQRYNGNGVDPNRDWPDIGYSFRGYSAISEPETQAWISFYNDVRKNGGQFSAGDDLHGQPFADALSYTLLPHGRHKYDKNQRIQETAQAINKSTYDRISWSPIVQANDQPQGGDVGCAPDTPVGTPCSKIYAQTWGSVYDTINYTTTGALGDWFDASIGLNADGVDNEMSFSHLDRNIIFDPHGEQMHVDGNKALLYAQITQLISPPRSRFTIRGKKGFVANARERRKRRSISAGPPPGTSPQPGFSGTGSPDPTAGGVVLPIDVKRTSKVYNGGMRVDVTNLNAQGIGSGVVSLKLQCKNCDAHPGERGPDDWITVTQDFNQSPAYLQAGVTASVNDPQAIEAHGRKVLWRALLENGGVARFDVHFSSGPASLSAETEPGALPPELRAYNVANTDFYPDFNPYIRTRTRRFRKISPRRVVRGKQKLSHVDSLVLSDLTGTRGLSSKQTSGWYRKLRTFVSRGGNLVLTDSALKILPRLQRKIRGSAVTRRISYVGQVTFARSDSGDTLGDPLSRGIKQPGARFNSGMRRQTYEPTPIGFTIQDRDGNDFSSSPVWQVDRATFEKAGGRIAATSVANEDTTGPPDHDQVSVGELKLGRGTVRIAGALLPQPSEKYDHDLGLEPYSVTYSGYTLMTNLLRPAHCVDDLAPRSRITRLRLSGARVRIRGRTSDRGCRKGGKGRVSKVTVSIARHVRGHDRCRYLHRSGRFGKVRSCHKGYYLRARGKGAWRLALRRRLRRGRYEVRARAFDSVGNRETGRTKRNTKRRRKRR